MRFLILILALTLAACDAPQQSGGKAFASIASPSADKATRWYNAEQVAMGAGLYAQHCTECHGKQAQGAVDWRKPEPDGKYPPPPLNGTGHAWHHPMQMLSDVIKNGSPPDQGKMPPWKDKLTDQEITAIIAWFQSHWPDQIYEAWLRRERQEQSRG